MFISKLQIIFAYAHVICIHVDAATEGVAFEVIVEPQAPLEQAQQQETNEHPAQGPVEPSPEQQQPEGKPRCTSYYFKFMTPKYVSITCALDLGIISNPSCMISRFP